MARKKIQDLVGTTLGNYKIIRCLGKGGMGTVYLGEHPTIRSKVAIKVLLPRFVADEEVTQRFLDEALAVNSIGHPGIVRIHDCDDHDDIGVYLIMEFLDGKSLQQVLDTEHELSTAAAAVVIMQAASALNACHKAGIIHRDLKPDNIYLVPDPDMPANVRIKLLDFGIAKLMADNEETGGRTSTGAVFGTPLYMSPEQCLDTKNVDRRSDIFSLGVIAYELLAKVLPYRADSLGKLVLRHQNDTPKRLRAIDPDIPEAVAEVIARALAKEVDDRYQSMAELREELLAATKGMTPEPLDQVVASDGEKELATELTMPATGDQIVATAETMAAEETGPPPLDEDAAQGDDEEEDVSQLETVHRASNTTLSASSGETARHSVVTEVDAGGKGKLLGGIAAAALVLIGLAAYFGMDSGPARDPSPPTAPAAASRAPRPAPPAPKPGGAAEAADGPGPGSSGQAGGRPAASHGDRHHHPGADPGRRRRHPGRLTGQGHQDQAPPGKPAAHPEGEPRRLPGRAAPVRGQQ